MSRSPKVTCKPRSGANKKGAVTRMDQIVAALTGRIHRGELAAGTRLQSVRSLAQQSGISIQTVLRAYDKLVAQGYLEARRGSGFYVKYCKRTAAAVAPIGLQAQPSDDDWHRLLHPGVPYACQMGAGNLPEAWLNQKALTAALRATSPAITQALSDYGDPRGYLPLRQLLQLKLLEYGIEADPQQILVCAGATEALHLVVWSLFRPGSQVLAEDPLPPCHTATMMANGLNIVHVPRQADGPDIDALRQACIRHRPLGLVCSSLLHNPTSSNLSPNKAFQVLQVAEEFDLTVVDDCTYADLLPASPLARPVPLATLDQLRRVIHIGSFSKTLAPGLRVGFLAAHPERVDHITLFKSGSTISSPPFGERVVHQLLSQGGYRHHCERLQARLQEQREGLFTQLRERGLVPQRTRAGMYLWLSLGPGVDARAIAAKLLLHGHVAAPAHGLFSTSPQYVSYMRINVAVACDNPALDLLAGEVAAANRHDRRLRRHG